METQVAYWGPGRNYGMKTLLKKFLPAICKLNKNLDTFIVVDFEMYLENLAD